VSGIGCPANIFSYHFPQAVTIFSQKGLVGLVDLCLLVGYTEPLLRMLAVERSAIPGGDGRNCDASTRTLVSQKNTVHASDGTNFIIPGTSVGASPTATSSLPTPAR